LDLDDFAITTTDSATLASDGQLGTAPTFIVDNSSPVLQFVGPWTVFADPRALGGNLSFCETPGALVQLINVSHVTGMSFFTSSSPGAAGVFVTVDDKP